MVTIKLHGREIPLLYTMYEMKTIQEEIAPVNTAVRMIMGQNPENEEDNSKSGSPEHIATVAKVVRILGNAGLEENGQEPNLTEKWIMRGIKPIRMVETANACLEAMAEGMKSEIPEKETDEPVDVTLEEMKKKERREN